MILFLKSTTDDSDNKMPLHDRPAISAQQPRNERARIAPYLPKLFGNHPDQ